MKRSLLNKWIEALESGQFVQGKGTLRNPDKDTYCCLGVLCEIAGLTKVSGITETRYVYKDSRDSNYLPAAFGIEQKFAYDYLLSRLNDTGTLFPEIAQKLRTHAENYMVVEDD
jgi:hypothetical protein